MTESKDTNPMNDEIKIDSKAVADAFNAAINRAEYLDREVASLYRFAARLLRVLPGAEFTDKSWTEYRRTETRALWTHPHSDVKDAFSDFGLEFHRDRHERLLAAINYEAERKP